MSNEIVPVTPEMVLPLGSEQSYLEDDIETDRSFEGESPIRSISRASWLGTRSLAEFMLVVTDPNLGLTTEQQTIIIEKVTDIIGDFKEFIDAGLNIDEEVLESPGDYHPLEGVLAGCIDDLTDLVDDHASADAEYAVSTSAYFSDNLYEHTAEGLIRLMRQRKRVLKKQHKQESK